MILSNKIFQTHSGCWDYGSTDEPKYFKNPIFKHLFFMLNRRKTRFDVSISINMTHLRVFGRKIKEINANFGVFFVGSAKRKP
jgi:hypothetical protein